MSDTPPPPPPAPDLAPLTADYDLVGELGSKSSTRILLASRSSGVGHRRGDDGRVLIEIVQRPEGDEANALQHLASDVKTLSGLHHRRLVQVIEGRWLGNDDAFAVVRERVDDPSLAERLAQSETFTNTRTAAILREVHGLLEWAREQNIVHRHVSPERIYLEPVTDRVRVTFAAGPIPRIRISDAETDDALSIVRLAVSMLTGRMDPAQREGLLLADLRPDLPDRLLEETAVLLGDPTPAGIDVPSFLALIGMADPLADGESERDRIRAEVLEEQRVEREKLANERAEFEGDKEAERRALAAEGEALRRVFAAEKLALEREFADAQQSLDAERVRMQRIIADERAALAQKHEDLELEMAARQAALDRAAAADRARMEELRERIRVAGEMEIERRRAMALEELDGAEIRLDTGELATPAFVRPYIASLDKVTFRDGTPLAPEAVRRAPKVADAARLERVVEDLKAPRAKPAEWRRWLVPGGIAAAVVIAAMSAIVVGQRTSNAEAVRRAPAAIARPTADPGASPTAAVMARARPTIGATPPRRTAAYVPPSAAAAAAARQWLDSARLEHPVDMQWLVLQSEAAERRAARARAARSAQVAAPAGDSVARTARTPASATTPEPEPATVEQSDPAPATDTIPKLNSSGIPQF